MLFLGFPILPWSGQYITIKLEVNVKKWGNYGFLRAAVFGKLMI
jgi:hypothetical protein